MNEDSYDAIASQWVAERKQSNVSRLIIALAERATQRGRILDIGCGGGVPIASYLQTQGFTITGIDISGEMIELARENLGTGSALFQTDIVDYESSDEFDGIVAWDSLFHVPHASQRAVFQKICGLLAKGGWFLFTHVGADGEFEYQMMGKPFYYAGLAPDVLRSWLVEVGFKIDFFALDYREDDMRKGLVAIVWK